MQSELPAAYAKGGQFAIDNVPIKQLRQGANLESFKNPVYQNARIQTDLGRALSGNPEAWVKMTSIDEVARQQRAAQASIASGMPGKQGGHIHPSTAAGFALMAADAAHTVHEANRLNDEGNATAAREALQHYAGRTAGGITGAAMGARLGLGLPGAIVGGIGGEIVGDWIASAQDAKVFTQKDSDGNTWTHNPKHPDHGWQRGGSLLTGPLITAPPELADKLDYQAANTAYEHALANPPVPPSPFIQPPNGNDTPSQLPGFSHESQPVNWQRIDGQWRRPIYENGTLENHPEFATPQRAAELDAAARQTMENNAATLSRPAIAAAYDSEYAQKGWAQHGETPKAVEQARQDVSTLTASNGIRYTHRPEKGQWVDPGLFFDTPARDEIREELEGAHETLRHFAAPPASAPQSSAVDKPEAVTDASRPTPDQVQGFIATIYESPEVEPLQISREPILADFAREVRLALNQFPPEITRELLATYGRPSPELIERMADVVAAREQVMENIAQGTNLDSQWLRGENGRGMDERNIGADDDWNAPAPA
jgi:hypothetical protein